MGSLSVSEFKKKAQAEKALIVYEDEATFRQTPTLHRTWAPRGCQPQIPTRGQRNSQKVLGAVSLYTNQFVYHHQTDYFNAETYLCFLEQQVLPGFYKRGRRIFLIQDNASYHKKPEVYDWLTKHRNKMEVFLLPAYSPEFNAVERIWYHTRRNATHNRYFDTPEDLCHSLFHTFAEIQRKPDSIAGYMRPFF